MNPIQSILNIFPSQTSLPNLQKDYTAALVGLGSTGSEIVANGFGNQRLSKVAEGMVFCSKIEAAKLKNIKKNRRHIVSNQGLGKDHVEGLRAWAEKLLQSVDQVRDVIDNYGIDSLLFINCLAGGTGIGSNLLIPALKNQRYVKRAVLFTIVPSDSEDRDLLRNTLNGLTQSLNLLDSKEMDFLLMAQSDLIVPNDTANFKQTDMNISRVLEMLLASGRIGDANVDISDIFRQYLYDEESPMDRIGTLGYESKPITRHNKDFASEVIKELVARVIENNWMRSDISQKCAKILFVIRADEKYLTDNNKKLIIQTAKKMVPKNCDIHVNVYSVPRLQKIELASLFKGIRTDIMSRFQTIIEESESDTEESAEPASVTAWEAMGFSSNPFPAQEAAA